MGGAMHAAAVDDLPGEGGPPQIAHGARSGVPRVGPRPSASLPTRDRGRAPRDRLPEGLEAWTAEPIVRVTGGEHLARAAWAFAHGMTILELDGRFPPGADLDAAWTAGIRALGAA